MNHPSVKRQALWLAVSGWTAWSCLSPVGATQASLYFRSHESVLCRELDEALRYEEEVGRKLTIIDTDNPKNAPLLKSYQVFWVPTVVVSEQGKELRRLERCHSVSELRAFLQGRELAQAGPTGGAAASSANVKMDCMDDTAADTQSGDLDIIRVCGLVTENKLKLRVDVSDAPSLQSSPKFNIFIDSDDDAETGYATAAFQGADYVVQGGFLYKFSGASSQEWKFDTVGSVTVEARGVSLNYSVPLSLVGKTASQFRVWVGSQTPKWEPADWAPEGSPLVVKNAQGSVSSNATPAATPASSPAVTPQQTTSEAVQSTPPPSASQEKKAPEPASSSGAAEGTNISTWSDPENDAPQPSLDLRNVKLSTTADKLIVQVELGGTPALSSLHIFIDADNNDGTGYGDGTRAGADFMIEGANLFKHQAAAGSGWGWDALGSITPAPAIKGNTVTFTIPRSRIGFAEGKKIKLWLAVTDSAWNTVDTMPDGAAQTYPE